MVVSKNGCTIFELNCPRHGQKPWDNGVRHIKDLYRATTRCAVYIRYTKVVVVETRFTNGDIQRLW